MIIDSYLPFHDKESGSKRLFKIIEILLHLNHHIIFVAKDGLAVEPYFSELINMGIEVIYKYNGKKRFKKDIIQKFYKADTAWICRPEINKKFAHLFTASKRPKWIYDTVDLHYIRMARESYLFPKNKKLKKDSLKYKKLETELANKADLTICITEVEQRELALQGINNTVVIPNIHDLKIHKFKEFENREDILFIGSFSHTPNEDAVIWLCKEIMPLVWAEIPEVKVILLGAKPTDRVSILANEKVKVMGYISDVSHYFENSRIFVAPLRFGAGMKGKIGHALEYGLPTVTTTIGAEGMGLADAKDILIANDPSIFAKKIIELYTNADLWQHIHQHSIEAILPLTTNEITKEFKKII